jgi:hypothetical protein
MSKNKKLSFDDYPIMDSMPLCKKHLETYIQAYHEKYYGRLRLELKTIRASESFSCQICGNRSKWDVHQMTEQNGLYQ